MAAARTASKTGSRDLTAEIAFCTRALKAPTLREAVPRLAERARTESWTHEEFLLACLQRAVSVATQRPEGGPTVRMRNGVAHIPMVRPWLAD